MASDPLQAIAAMTRWSEGFIREADLPVIGPATVTAAARAGLAGIVIAAGGVMVIDLPEVVRRCDAMGLFLWVRPA